MKTIWFLSAVFKVKGVLAGVLTIYKHVNDLKAAQYGNYGKWLDEDSGIFHHSRIQYFAFESVKGILTEDDRSKRRDKASELIVFI